MELIFAALMIIAIPVSVIAVAVLAPLCLGLMAYDVYIGHRGDALDTAEDLRTRIAVERGIARAFVVAGGIFWSVAVFAGLMAFRESGIGVALLGAFYPLVAVLATLVIGWYFERFAAALLTLASVAVVAWGVIYQFEMGVWVIMTFTLVGPMATAAVLFWLARDSQKAFDLAVSLDPEWAVVPVRTR